MKILAAIAMVSVCSIAQADIGYIATLAPIAGSGSNPGGFAADVGVDYAREGFRMDLLTFGISTSYESVDSVDWVISSSIEARVTEGIYAGFRAGLQYIDSSPSVSPSVWSFSALTATAIAPSGWLMGIDVGLGLQSRYSKVSLGRRF